MSSTDLVLPQHLARQALIYIRQSTPHQVLSNQESLRLQYALRDRALSLGWRAEAIEVIDTDLGLSGSSANQRMGFQTLLTRVTLGEVGIILSSEVTRLSRNCSDWYPLLDVCAWRGCLIADNEGIYDPASPNGRLLLGLKGQLSELELHTIRARMTAGLLHKAERGELALQLPVGLSRDSLNRVVKDPNLEVQARLQLVFDTFLRVRSANKVLQFFQAHELLLPRHDRFGDIIWKPPTVATVLFILKNPAYAGAFVYGRSRTTHSGVGVRDVHTTRLPMAQWKIRVNDKYPAYISWETFEQIQAMLQDNYAQYDRNKTRGLPRDGAALLQGLVYCGECGHKMVVQYKAGTRYICNYLRQQHHVPVCQYIPADPVDAAVVAAFFEALAPVELDAYSQAAATARATADQLAQAQQQHVERLRYEAALAERQFLRVDPDNRLVAAELERRWESALHAAKAAEVACAASTTAPPLLPEISEELKAAFLDVGPHLPRLWEEPGLGRVQRKALLRCLIDKVVIHRPHPDQVQTRIVWRGGATTTLAVPVPVGSFADLPGAAQMEQLILDLFATGCSDEQIADQLTAQGYRSPMASVVLSSTVRIIRLKHRLFQKRSQSHPRQVPGYLTVTQVARLLEVSVHWIYDRIHKGTIQIGRDSATHLYLFPDQPATLDQLRLLKDGLVSSVAI